LNPNICKRNANRSIECIVKKIRSKNGLLNRLSYIRGNYEKR
jgi:hypothetical protein